MPFFTHVKAMSLAGAVCPASKSAGPHLRNKFSWSELCALPHLATGWLQKAPMRHAEEGIDCGASKELTLTRLAIHSAAPRKHREGWSINSDLLRDVFVSNQRRTHWCPAENSQNGVAAVSETIARFHSVAIFSRGNHDAGYLQDDI